MTQAFLFHENMQDGNSRFVSRLFINPGGIIKEENPNVGSELESETHSESLCKTSETMTVTEHHLSDSTVKIELLKA